MKTVDLLRPNSADGLSGDPAVSMLFEDRPFVLPLPEITEQTSRPGPATVKPVRPEAIPVSIGLSLASSLRNRWVLYLGRRQQLENDPSEEAVHELRVATRRLMAQLDLFAAVVPSNTAEKARRILKRSMKPLGRLRDIQVQRVFVEGQLDAFPKLILFRDHLQKRESTRIASAAAKVDGLKIRKFEKWISLMFQDLAEKTNDPRQQARLSGEVIRVLEKTYAAVVRRRRAIQTGDLATIHATRVAFKKFRYVVESLSPTFTGFDERQLAALALYQRRMGAIQDLEIVQTGVTRFIERYQAADEFFDPFLRHLRQLQARALLSFTKQADQIFEFNLPALRV